MPSLPGLNRGFLRAVFPVSARCNVASRLAD
nr:MAG TPA: hypothetical protein [Caudoviricetes sp.]